MPEYLTKSEPVDKKPFIQYTGEKDADAANGNGGVSGYDVEFSYNEQGENYTSDKTFSEISAAIESGSIVVAKLDDGSLGGFRHFYICNSTEDAIEFICTFVDTAEPEAAMFVILTMIIASDDSVTNGFYTIPLGEL